LIHLSGSIPVVGCVVKPLIVALESLSFFRFVL